MIRRTLQWVLAIVLLAGACGGGYAYWFFSQSNDLLREQIYALLAEKLPNCDASIGPVRFDWSRKVHLYDVKIRIRGEEELLARCSEIVVGLDADALAANQRVDVRTVRIIRPELSIVREHDGRWNWQRLAPFPEPSEINPEISFEDLQALISIPSPDGLISFGIEEAAVRLVPSARRQFRVDASAKLPGAGLLQVNGALNLETKTWSLDGGTPVPAKVAEIVNSVRRIVPSAEKQFAEAERTLAQQTASLGTETTLRSQLNLSGQANIHFHASQAEPQSAIKYGLVISFAQAQLEHALLPFPLRELTGAVAIDGKRLTLKNLRAHHGATRVVVDGSLSLAAPEPKDRLAIKLADVELDRRLRSRLPESMRRYFDAVRPGGTVDAAGAIARLPDGGWKPEGWTVTAKGCTASHEKFPYPLADIVGTITQQADQFDLNLTGTAGGHRGRLNGRVIDPGPDAEADYVVQVEALPINETLMTAASVHPPLFRTLSALRLGGDATTTCRFHRQPGPNQKMEWKLSVAVAHGSLEYEHFPYRIADLTGSVEFDSKTGVWAFRQLHGRHGAADINGAGAFTKTGPDDPGRLELEIHARNVPLEKELFLSFPQEHQQIWERVDPKGTAAIQVNIGWVPREKLELSVPEISVTDGSMEIDSFPYPIEHITAKFAYEDNRIAILAFEGHHDETVLRTGMKAAGSNPYRSFVQCPAADDPDGQWKLRLDPLYIDDLVPDRTLRRALPPGLKSTIQTLDPQGKVNLSGMLELRGAKTAGNTVTAAWDMKTVLAGSSMITGVELKNVHGTVDSSGTWDGQRALMEGQVDLESATVLGHQFTQVRGPFRLENGELTVGSTKAFQPIAPGGREATIAPEERISARAVDGNFFLDAQAQLNEQKTSYRVKAAMVNGSLEKYAQRYLRGMNSLRGLMRGWIELAGDTPDAKDAHGRGQLLIYPAALYELPVVMQLFQAFSFKPRNSTAFNYALATFDIARRQVGFREIDLIGDAISMHGYGTANFDGAIRLDFYSKTKNPLPIPLVRELIDEAMKGWIGVKVTGTISQPSAVVTAAPQFDAFLKAINPRPGPTPPPLTPPWGAPYLLGPASTQRPQPNRAVR